MIFGNIITVVFTKDEEEKVQKIEDCFKNLEAFLTEHHESFAEGWLVGDQLTAADFFMGSMYTNYFNNEGVNFGIDRFKELLGQFPNWQAYGQRFSTEIQEHLDNRGTREY